MAVLTLQDSTIRAQEKHLASGCPEKKLNKKGNFSLPFSILLTGLANSFSSSLIACSGLLSNKKPLLSSQCSSPPQSFQFHAH